MCGIAGRILRAPGRVGNDLVEVMDAQEHRGADSTGFAIYGAPRDSGYVLRGMGFDKNRIDADMDDFRAILRDHGTDLLPACSLTVPCIFYQIEQGGDIIVLSKFPGMEHSEPYMAHVAPGKTGEILWKFSEPGEFGFGCLIPGHFDAGMKGRVIVGS